MDPVHIVTLPIKTLADAQREIERLARILEKVLEQVNTLNATVFP